MPILPPSLYQSGHTLSLTFTKTKSSSAGATALPETEEQREEMTVCVVHEQLPKVKDFISRV